MKSPRQKQIVWQPTAVSNERELTKPHYDTMDIEQYNMLYTGTHKSSTGFTFIPSSDLLLPCHSW